MTVPDYLTDLAGYLTSEGVATAGTDLFLYDFSARVQNCIALTPTSGLSNIVSLSGDSVLHRPEVNVRIRNASPKQAEDKAALIHNTLNLLVNTTYGSTRFKRISALSDPFFLSKDGNNGTIFATNFILEIE